MTREALPKPARFEACYGCGQENPRGLALRFFRDGDSVVADFTPAPEHGGYGKVLHGGVTATLVDEAFGWGVYGLTGKLGMTTDLQVKFLAPLRTAEVVTVRAWLVREDARAVEMRAEVRDARGELGAEATATLRLVSPRAVERIGGLEAGSISGTQQLPGNDPSR